MYKAVTLKIFRPGNASFDRRIVRAPKGRVFKPEGIESVILRTVNVIEKHYPGEDYRLVPTGPASFNFVHQGKTQDASP